MEFTRGILSTLRDYAYAASSDLAAEKGCFAV